MFNFFKKKKNKSDVLVEMALGLLQIQISLGSSEDNKKLNKITLDRFSRGYIFGLCDSVLQSSGKKDCKDYNELMHFLKNIHIELFGEKDGVNVLNTSCNEVQNQIFMKGRMKGGQEFVEFIRDNKAPMGLATYLQKNIK
jgi:hypothetical protein